MLTSLIYLITYTLAFNLTAIDKNNILIAHNHERSLVCLPNLTWDDNLADSATNYAQKCQMKHSSLPSVGENLWGGSLPWTHPVNSVYSWIGEKNQWTCGFCCNEDTGHYTQIVWNDTQRIGCGMEICKYQDFELIWIVCHYSPPGNGRRNPFPTMNCQKNGNCDTTLTDTTTTLLIPTTTTTNNPSTSTLINTTTLLIPTTNDTSTSTLIDTTQISSINNNNNTLIMKMIDTSLDKGLLTIDQVFIGICITIVCIIIFLCFLYFSIISQLKEDVKVTDDIFTNTKEDEKKIYRFNSARTEIDV